LYTHRGHRVTQSYTELNFNYKNKCEHARAQHRYYYVNPSELKFEDFLALQQIWDRLRIWVPGLPELEKHPNASEPAPDWF
jgi:hypothetical protein